MTDPNPPPHDQLLLFAAVAAPAVEQGRPAIQEQRPPDQARGCPEKGDGEEGAYLELMWDFRDSFPEPMIEAFVHGTPHPDNADPENIQSIHFEHAAEGQAILDELEALEVARQHGIDPSTGKPPRAEKKREELAELFANELGRIRRRFDVHLAAYAGSRRQDQGPDQHDPAGAAQDDLPYPSSRDRCVPPAPKWADRRRRPSP